MSGTEIAALLAAGAFVVLVVFFVLTLVKLNRAIDATTTTVNQIARRVDPILTELETTVAATNAQLAKIDAVTDHVGAVTGSVSTVFSLLSSTVTNPLVKAASVAYGLREAVKTRWKKTPDTKRKKGTQP